MLEMNSKPVCLSASWKVKFVCFTSVSLGKLRLNKLTQIVLCCKEIGQYDLLEVPSSPPVPILLIYLPAASSNFLLQTSKPNSIFHGKSSGACWYEQEQHPPPSVHKASGKKPGMLPWASSVSASTFKYLFGKVRIILCLKLSVNLC